MTHQGRLLAGQAHDVDCNLKGKTARSPTARGAHKADHTLDEKASSPLADHGALHADCLRYSRVGKPCRQ